MRLDQTHDRLVLDVGLNTHQLLAVASWLRHLSKTLPDLSMAGAATLLDPEERAPAGAVVTWGSDADTGEIAYGRYL